LKLTPDDVRNIIWKWWETIKKIIDQTGVAIDFKEDGTTIITAENWESAQKAIAMIEEIIWKPEIWMKIKWKIIRVESFGVFVDLWHGKTGLCHISNLSKDFIKDPKELFKEGDEILVEISNIKDDGKIEIKKIED
jgi:polyribonucleotide nucleotidyltransferase